MKYPRLLAALRSAKWAVTPVTLQAIRDALSARLSGRLSEVAAGLRTGLGSRADDSMEIIETDGIVEPLPAAFAMVAPGVASVQMHGIIGKHLSQFEMDCGGCDVSRVEQNLTLALADSGVLAVILDIDSPGGTVSGVAELSAKISALSLQAGKPIIAYADGQCCSAAYWISCGCTAIACSPSSDIGSIGVYMALVDESANWAEEGYKLVLIKAGDWKAAGIAGSEITPEQIALWKTDVDLIYADFTAAVRAARPGIAETTMQGQSFYGSRALAMNLVDRLIPDLATLAEEIAPTAAAILAPATPTM